MEAILDADDSILPTSAIAFTRLLLADSPAWDKMSSKDRLPKPKAETLQEVEAVHDVLLEVIRQRMSAIQGSRTVSQSRSAGNVAY